MASNPPFQVEDQTDEDFFDKLVDDEFEGTEPGSKFAEGSDSDEVKAFAKLSMGDVGTATDNSGCEGELEAKRDGINRAEDVVSSDAHAEESNSLVSSSSFGFSSVIESNNGVVESEVGSDSTESKSSGPGASGVKEVQWSAFNSDVAQNGTNGFGSYSDFFNDLGESAGNPAKVEDISNSEAKTGSVKGAYETEDLGNLVNYEQTPDTHDYGTTVEQSVSGQDLSTSQYWESLYPGWRYDPNTGQWYQEQGDVFEVTENNQGNFENNSAVGSLVSDGKPEVSYLQQTAQTVAGTVIESGTTASVSNWSEGSQVNNGYPEHMVFDPQYPGWYYDTIAQEWLSLETYVASGQTSFQANNQHNQNEFPSTGTLYNNSSSNSSSRVHDNYGQADSYGSQGYGGQDSSWSGSSSNFNQPNQNGFAYGTSSHNNNSNVYDNIGQPGNYGSQGFGGQVQDSTWGGSFSNRNQQGLNMWQPETISRSEPMNSFGGNQQVENMYGSKNSISNHVDQSKSVNSLGTVSLYDKASLGHDASNRSELQNFVPGGTFSKQFNQAKMEQNEQMHFPNDPYSTQKSLNFSEQSFQGGHQFNYASPIERSSAGRPPHALVAFGFGGKLIVMKENNSLSNSSYGNQEPVGGSVSVLNLMEVVTDKTDALSNGVSASSYFRTLCQQSLPGPLVGGNVGSKELNKWLDLRIANCESPDMDHRKGEALRLLLSLLRIACQHYGKLRSPFGSDTLLRESDSPESAVAKLFASSKSSTQVSRYGALTHCLQQLPSEGQIRATASEVQNLLVSGRKIEALHCAQEGQLWGPALVLASQLGDQFYIDTVKQMALRQLVVGSPLRTLCLLIAGQPAEVFSIETTADSDHHGAVNMSPQPAQFGANGMLDDWEENLAVITTNRTKGDELVLIHLGDCLWKERSEIIAAHICYLVAEANFELYSDSARLCLIGADHWKYPRTYSSPEAIQRTELYEYSKVLGNSQFILLPFQPYKLIYAYMLAEVGKVSDSLKYCQAVLKSLKTSRAPEVETWKQIALSLEERIRTHQQGGYATNLAPAKLVGKLLNFFDSTAQRVVGGLPPPIPSISQGSAQGTEHNYQQVGPRVSTSQSTMAISSLMPSGSMEHVSEWTADSNRRTMHNRSASEPDFGRTPRQDQVELSNAEASSHSQGKTSGGPSRFGRFSFGSQLLQKTVGLVLKPRGEKQAKLGETNKFYYDEKLKRWVEEGAEPPAEEAALPPPPTAAAFQNGTSDYSLKNASSSEGFSTNGSPNSITTPPSEGSSGMPSIPPGSNQFSARGRMGVRSRYVDTFNQGGGSPANLFQSPSVPSVKSSGAANAKFFIPTATSSGGEAFPTIAENAQEGSTTNEDPSTSFTSDSFQSPPTVQRFPSMDNIPNNGVVSNGYGPYPSRSRRAASWGGSFNEAFSPPKGTEVKPLGEALGMPMPPSSYMPTDPSLMRLPMNGASFPDDLQEVEL